MGPGHGVSKLHRSSLGARSDIPGVYFVAVWMKFLENPGGNFFKTVLSIINWFDRFSIEFPGLISLYTFAKYKNPILFGIWWFAI